MTQTLPSSPPPGADIVVAGSSTVATMSDADLYEAARTAARTHESSAVAPYLEEMGRRRFDVSKVLEVTTILWPPAWTNLRMKTRGTR